MRQKERLLRHYEAVAWQEHQCSMCQTAIHAGDYYEGYVKVNNGKIRVNKYHLEPYCPDEFFDQEKDYTDEETSDLEEAVDEEAPVSSAA